MGGILNAIKGSAAGLSVQRAKMNAVADNIANAETTRTKAGGPYRRQSVIVSENREKLRFSTLMQKAGNKLLRTNSKHMTGTGQTASGSMEISKAQWKTERAANDAFKLIYEPNHPHADEDGYVKMPDVEIITEMVDMMAASRGYEANTVAISAAKNMASEALDI